MQSKILVTGAAGFIGFHLSKRLIRDGYLVTGIDNINDYYDVNLKKARLAILEKLDGFKFRKIELADKTSIDTLFGEIGFDYVVNLAAQAGVRYSLQNPYAYIDSNIYGFLNILEACRHNPVKHLVFASSSSVYGANTKMPFSIHHNVDHPISLYAASKKANELMAHTYASLYKIPSTGLRFFTVYGPWGRPDMALFLFTKAIFEGKAIDVYNHGKMKRDFTYVDDIVEGMVRLIPKAPGPDPEWSGEHPDPSSSFAPYRIYNIGNNQPVELMKFIETIERHAGRKAEKNYMEIQQGDVPATFADVDDLMRDVGFRPNTSIDDGIRSFIAWYKEFFKIS
jgi:UDP-glucuronate 4-epimerase